MENFYKTFSNLLIDSWINIKKVINIYWFVVGVIVNSINITVQIKMLNGASHYTQTKSFLGKILF